MTDEVPLPPDHVEAEGECIKHGIGPVGLRKQRVAGDLVIKFCPVCACKDCSRQAVTNRPEEN